jgi:DNA-binding transcriptional regulator YiaG
MCTDERSPFVHYYRDHSQFSNLMATISDRESARMSALAEEVRESLSLPSPGVAREIREAAMVSQERLAAELGVHPLTVLRWEAGTRTPQGELRRAYARLLRELQDAARETA